MSLMAIRMQDIHTFFVVARSGTMQGAAQELGVSPGAISQRVRLIEEQYGKRLFSRTRNGVSLTKAGDALWSDTEIAFLKIEAASQKHFSKHTQSHIRISAAPTFAYTVLVPRLGDFVKNNPQIKITIDTDHRLVDLKSEPVDLAIRHGLGKYTGYETVWLSSPELVVVGSPGLLADGKPIEEAIDCLSYPLLQDTEASCSDWQLWMDARGLHGEKVRYGPAFKDDFMIIKAAIAGQGLALLHDVYVNDELHKGTLIKACSAAWPTNFAYYAVTLPETRSRPAVKKFVKWLQAVSEDAQRSSDEPMMVRNS